VSARYIHDFSLVFCIRSDSDTLDLTADEVRQVIIDQLNDMSDEGLLENIEFINTIDDTET
jgi:hypothetical protein